MAKVTGIVNRSFRPNLGLYPDARNDMVPYHLVETMAAYRVYRIDNSGHVQGQPEIIECESDDDARLKAQCFVDGCGIEVWDKARKVASFPPNGRSPVNLPIDKQ